MLIKHLRKIEHGQPVKFATVVVLDDGRVGASLCSDKDSFSRKLGRKIAANRARSDRRNIPNLQRDKVISFAFGGSIIACTRIDAIQAAMSRLAEKHAEGVAEKDVQEDYRREKHGLIT